MRLQRKSKKKKKRVCVCSHSHLFLGRCKTMLTHTGGRFEQMLTRLRTRLLTVLRITLASICGFIIDYSLTRYLYLFLLILDRYAITLRNILVLGMQFNTDAVEAGTSKSPLLSAGERTVLSHLFFVHLYFHARDPGQAPSLV